MNTKYNQLVIETLQKEIKDYDRYLSMKNPKGDSEYYLKTKTKIEKELKNRIENGSIISYKVKEKKEKTNIQDEFYYGSIDWFGSTRYKDIDKDSLTLSKLYNISLYDSLTVMLLAHEIMSLNTKLTMNENLRKAFIKTNKIEKANSIPTKKETEEKIEQTKNKISEIIDKKLISNKEYTEMYIGKLEKDRGYSKNYDEFLDWLNDSLDYGVFSTFAETEGEGFGKYYNDFANETIKKEDFK